MEKICFFITTVDCLKSNGWNKILYLFIEYLTPPRGKSGLEGIVLIVNSEELPGSEGFDFEGFLQFGFEDLELDLLDVNILRTINYLQEEIIGENREVVKISVNKSGIPDSWV